MLYLPQRLRLWKKHEIKNAVDPAGYKLRSEDRIPDLHSFQSFQLQKLINLCVSMSCKVLLTSAK
jgi:hypothetical protein